MGKQFAGSFAALRARDAQHTGVPRDLVMVRFSFNASDGEHEINVWIPAEFVDELTKAGLLP